MSLLLQSGLQNLAKTDTLFKTADMI